MGRGQRGSSGDGGGGRFPGLVHLRKGFVLPERQHPQGTSANPMGHGDVGDGYTGGMQ